MNYSNERWREWGRRPVHLAVSTQTHTNTHTLARTHTRAHPPTHTHTHSNPHTHTFALSHRHEATERYKDGLIFNVNFLTHACHTLNNKSGQSKDKQLEKRTDRKMVVTHTNTHTKHTHTP